MLFREPALSRYSNLNDAIGYNIDLKDLHVLAGDRSFTPNSYYCERL